MVEGHGDALESAHCSGEIVVIRRRIKGARPMGKGCKQNLEKLAHDHDSRAEDAEARRRSQRPRRRAAAWGVGVRGMARPWEVFAAQWNRLDAVPPRFKRLESQAYAQPARTTAQLVTKRASMEQASMCPNPKLHGPASAHFNAPLGYKPTLLNSVEGRPGHCCGLCCRGLQGKWCAWSCHEGRHSAKGRSLGDVSQPGRIRDNLS